MMRRTKRWKREEGLEDECLVEVLPIAIKSSEEEHNMSQEEESPTPPPKVELKPLPPSLKYAFLDSERRFPIIVNANLDDPSLAKLIDLLRKYKGVIGYSIDDHKGISPSICMHHIHLEDEQASSIELQRRLNPTLKEVVKNGVLKLSEAGITYAISDSK